MKKAHLVVLYIYSPSRLSHIRKIRSLRNEFEVTILHAKVPYLDYIHEFCHHAIAVDTTNSDENFASIAQQLSLLPTPDAVINLSEPFLPIHSRLCQHFALPGPSEQAVEVGRNKYNMRVFARELKIPIPNFFVVTADTIEQCKELVFPVIAKPVMGCGSILVERFQSYKELVQNFSRLDEAATQVFSKDSQYRQTVVQGYPFIIEEIVGGEVLYRTSFPVSVGEISVESVFYNDNVEVLAVHDKPLPNNGPYFEEVGYSTPTRIPIEHQQQAFDYVSRIHRKLGPGCIVLHTEFRTLQDSLVLIEFGVRMGGGAIYNSLLASTQTDFIDVQIDIALGRKVRISRGKPVPTITQYLFPKKQGRIIAIEGEPALVREPTYVEHQIYDDVGNMAFRAPMATRSTMHVLFRDAEFPALEQRVLKAVGNFTIHTDMK